DTSRDVFACQIEATFDRDVCPLNNTTHFLRTDYDNSTAYSQSEEISWLAILLNIISDGIVEYYLWVLCGVGLPGNTLTIVTILTMESYSPATFLVATLSFFDGLTLVIKFVGLQLYLLRVPIGRAGCVVSSTLVMFLAAMSNWSLILITSERFIAVCFPLRRAYLITSRRIHNAVVIVAALLFSVSLVTSIATVDEVLGEWYCSPDVNHNIYYWMIGTLYVNIPFVCITILTAAVLRGLHVSGKRHRRLLQREDHYNSGGAPGKVVSNDSRIAMSNRVEVTLTSMMVSSAAIFLILFLPALLIPSIVTPPADDSTVQSQWRLFSEIRYLLLDLSHAINFFLYFLTAKKFRKHVFKILSFKGC
ncbi:unnamed protein product, partial [Lymnaea stagnalis]